MTRKYHALRAGRRWQWFACTRCHTVVRRYASASKCQDQTCRGVLKRLPDAGFVDGDGI